MNTSLKHKIGITQPPISRDKPELHGILQTPIKRRLGVLTMEIDIEVNGETHTFKTVGSAIEPEVGSFYYNSYDGELYKVVEVDDMFESVGFEVYNSAIEENGTVKHAGAHWFDVDGEHLHKAEKQP